MTVDLLDDCQNQLSSQQQAYKALDIMKYSIVEEIFWTFVSPAWFEWNVL